MALADLAHRVLVTRAERRGYRRLWRAAVNRWGEQAVRTRLHGHDALINFANPYPRTVAAFPSYNMPQITAIRAAAEARGRRVHVVDVGTAVGDTALLILQRAESHVASLTCIEGDPHFAELARRNLDGRATIHQVMLSAETGSAPELVRAQHPGTATAVGDRQVPTTTLDAVLDGGPVDVLKIDTDGYDGRVLAGATATLKQRPVVLFEWHPRACAAAGTDEREPFRLLGDYSLFVFYLKYGLFAFAMHHVDHEALDRVADVCRSDALPDWHYDVIAVPDESVSLQTLAATGAPA